MNALKRAIVPVIHLWLAGVLFLLWLVGYAVFGVFWMVRFMQTRIRMAVVVVAALLLLLAIGAVAVRYLFFEWGRSAQSVSVVIAKGQSVRAIADTLLRQRIITAKPPLYAWLRFSGIERKIQAGRIEFFPGEGVVAASRRLLNAEPIETPVTVQEGLTIEQTAARIAALMPLDTGLFISLCRDRQFMDECGVTGEASLEGYLFPDTYRFLEAATARDIIRRMTGRFHQEYHRLDTNAAAVRGMTRRDVVTLASIVEKEAVLAAERSRIAGVFHNRLKRGYPLGADPTVRYLFKKWSGPLYVSELNVNSPYNTRRFAGLPPGPICSPGLASLQATVSPLETNELYFVAKWDGSGAHDFSVSNQEHDHKKMKIRRENIKRLQQKERR
ncbi:MAG: endolytic transglycosylase MltG [Chitinispirillaceae bacterium]|nr:endolytic transglycosylase MltG [Chitinispirillaceae bacterium]